MTLRTFSFGGGVQSTAVLVLAAMGRVQYDTFLFANVGNDSENPRTLEYVETVAKPYAKRNGVELVELNKTHPNGKSMTILGELYRRNTPGIPIYFEGTGPARRSCTKDFKIDVIARWQKQHGATPTTPAVCGLGISMDEIQRARGESGIAWQTLEYPLLDLRMNRRDCVKVIQDAGLPVPPKSSCWFCPFHRRDEWMTLKREQPELFAKAVDLENLLNERRATLGCDRIYMHASLTPLAQAVGDQMTFDFPEAVDDMPCDTGHCFI